MNYARFFFFFYHDVCIDLVFQRPGLVCLCHLSPVGCFCIFTWCFHHRRSSAVTALRGSWLTPMQPTTSSRTSMSTPKDSVSLHQMTNVYTFIFIFYRLYFAFMTLQKVGILCVFCLL